MDIGRLLFLSRDTDLTHIYIDIGNINILICIPVPEASPTNPNSTSQGQSACDITCSPIVTRSVDGILNDISTIVLSPPDETSSRAACFFFFLAEKTFVTKITVIKNKNNR